MVHVKAILSTDDTGNVNLSEYLYWPRQPPDLSMGSRKGQQGLGESEQGLVVLSILSQDLENETLVKSVDDPQVKGEGTLLML